MSLGPVAPGPPLCTKCGKHYLQGEDCCGVCLSLGKITSLVYSRRFPAGCGHRASRALHRCYLELLAEADEYFNVQAGFAGVGPTGGAFGPLPPLIPAAPGIERPTITGTPAAQGVVSDTAGPSGKGPAEASPASRGEEKPLEERKAGREGESRREKDKKEKDKGAKKEKREKDKGRKRSESPEARAARKKEETSHREKKVKIEPKSPEPVRETVTEPVTPNPASGSRPERGAAPAEKGPEIEEESGEEEEEEEESVEEERERSKSPLPRRGSSEGSRRPVSPPGPPPPGRGGNWRGPIPAWKREREWGRGAPPYPDHPIGLAAKSKPKKWKNRGRKKVARQAQRRLERQRNYDY